MRRDPSQGLATLQPAGMGLAERWRFEYAAFRHKPDKRPRRARGVFNGIY